MQLGVSRIMSCRGKEVFLPQILHTNFWKLLLGSAKDLKTQKILRFQKESHLDGMIALARDFNIS
jgi:hypothetical protein